MIPLPMDARVDVRVMVDPVPSPALGTVSDNSQDGTQVARDQWVDTSLARMGRSTDLPLSLCPDLRLSGYWDGDGVVVDVQGLPRDVTVRLQSEGACSGEVPTLRWVPKTETDQLNVAARTVTGLAIAGLRVREVKGRRG